MKSAAKKAGYLAEYFLFLILILVVWFVMDGMGKLNPVIMPSPSKIGSTLVSLIEKGTLMDNLVVSVVRVLQGYLLAAGLGVVLGILIGLSKHLDRTDCAADPDHQANSTIAWIPLVICGLGSVRAERYS